MAELLPVARDLHAAVALRKQADHMSDSYINTFWNPTASCLFDVVRPDKRDTSMRPNQLLAVSSPFTRLATDQQRAVFDVATHELLAAYGLQTLARHSEKYAPKFTGTMRQRDFARHQGAVWSWWIGPYADAFLHVHGTGKAPRNELGNLLQPRWTISRTTAAWRRCSMVSRRISRRTVWPSARQSANYRSRLRRLYWQE